MMMPTFKSHDAKIMRKKTYQIWHHETPNVPKPKQFWSLMLPAFESQDVKIKPKILTKSRQHERPEIPYPP